METHPVNNREKKSNAECGKGYKTEEGVEWPTPSTDRLRLRIFFL